MSKTLKIFLSLAIPVTFASALLFYYESRAVSSTGITATVAVGVCGNNIVEYGEVCDGSALDGQNCESLGYDGGALNCNTGCDFNISECVDLEPEDTTGSVVFSGWAYSASVIKILNDGHVAATTASSDDGKFATTLSNLTAGSYSFSVYAYDNNDKKSETVVYRKQIGKKEILEIPNIIIAPTINAGSKEIKKGESINIYGQGIPNEKIEIQVFSAGKDVSETVTVKENGDYSYNLNTDNLDYGSYEVKAKTILADGQVSEFDSAIPFLVSTRTILADAKASCSDAGDYNGDCKINLIDFSMLLFWYEKSAFPENIDLNNDKKINLVDFSILVYNWTG